MASPTGGACLHEQASAHLELIQLGCRLAGFEHYLTGSYVLQAMAWPDIDVNVLYRPAERPAIYALGADCLRELSPKWFEFRCTEGELGSPGHFFLGFEVEWQGAVWNADLLVLVRS
jgi:hypothetical protein